MAISSWSAGIIRPVPVAPTGPFQDGAAPGVWTLDEAAFWTKQGLWPTAGNFPPGNQACFLAVMPPVCKMLFNTSQLPQQETLQILVI